MLTGWSFFPGLERDVTISDGPPTESSLIFKNDIFIVLPVTEIEKPVCSPVSSERHS